MKKMVALLSFIVLFASLLLLPDPTKVNAGVQIEKRSEELKLRMEAMEKDETIQVYIWFEDLDLGDVEAEAERRVGYTKKEVIDACKAIPNFPRDVNESDPNFEKINAEYERSTRAERMRVLEMMNNFYSARTAIVREAYENYNQKNFETIAITPEQLCYVSHYSSVILANLTVDEIDRLEGIADVIWLDYEEPEEPIMEFNVALPAVDADYVRNTEGYDGQGVVIGMIDEGNIDTTNTATARAAART